MCSHTVSLVLYTQPLRQLVTTPPSGYSLVGANIDGVNDSNGTITTSIDADFGSNIAISDDGTRIVVGAWASNGNGATNFEQKGGVFIYDWGGTEWNYLTHLEGTIAPVGRTLTLSPDGALLALRVSATLYRVYDVTSGTLTQVGSDIACASGAGTGLAFTQPTDSSLLLASGCSSSNNDGTVKVVQYTKTTGTWTADSIVVETPPAGTIGTLFGFDLAWNAAGTRLAIGEPNFNDTSTGGTNNGRVLVYDFDGTSFTSFGTDIVGSGVSKLGFSLALSDDGTTLVFGSPNKDANTGDVKGMLVVLQCLLGCSVARVSHSLSLSLSLFILQSINSTLLEMTTKFKRQSSVMLLMKVSVVSFMFQVMVPSFFPLLFLLSMEKADKSRSTNCQVVPGQRLQNSLEMQMTD